MGIRILVFNDTQEILELFEEILGQEGYEVILYSYAITDMPAIQRIKPDLIILDLIFGFEKSGWQMLQKLKMVRSTANIPVIVCTAATREVREIEGYLQAKGVGLIPKPFNIDDLLTEVKRQLAMYPHEPETVMQKTEQEDETGATPPASASGGRGGRDKKDRQENSGGDKQDHQGAVKDGGRRGQGRR